MSYIDQNLVLSDAQAVTATAVSTKSIDTITALRNIGSGNQIEVLVGVGTAFTAAGAATTSSSAVAATISSGAMAAPTRSMAATALTSSTARTTSPSFSSSKSRAPLT